jgi:osmotically-inducible protein OsmY
MKRSGLLFGLAGALALAGCGHPTAEASKEESLARGETHSTFDQAYSAVRSGARAMVHWGEYVIDRTAAGTVRVYRSARQKVAGRVGGEPLSDQAITTEVKGRLAADGAVPAGSIQVSTDAGVVTLRGTVERPSQASRAVQDAVGAPGVSSVNSELTWPGASAAGAM